MTTENITQLKAVTARPPTVGDVLDDLLETHNLTQAEVAERLGVGRITISHLINGHRPLSPDMARRLGRFWGNGAAFWIRLQQQVDLWDALHDDNEYDSIEPFVLVEEEREVAA